MNRVVLIILDGFGISSSKIGNATLKAKYIQHLIETKPCAFLDASDEYVGLERGQFGNSEVGHLTIGAGRILKQKLTLINDSISDGSFSRNEDVNAFLKDVRACHLMALFSNGGVHAHVNHFFKSAEMLRSLNINIKAHLILDGRDVAYNDSLNTLKKALDSGAIKLPEIATIHGRFYAMDRDNRWDRTETSYSAIKNGVAEVVSDDPLKTIKDYYDSGVYDEVIPPFVMDWYNGLESGESFWMLNFRTDRIKQILKFIVSDNIRLMDMVSVSSEIDSKSTVIFKHSEIKNTLGEIVSNGGFRQLRVAETEKYAHVTYFFNGGKDIVYPNEDRMIIDSPKVVDYADTPGMSSNEITNAVVYKIREQKYDFIVVNYANADMLGHTGSLEATEESLSILDRHIEQLVSIGAQNGYDILVTADHGNAESMIGDTCKTHTCSKVPFIYISRDKAEIRTSGSLQDIAPTVLYLLGLTKPNRMSGTSLIYR